MTAAGLLERLAAQPDRFPGAMLLTGPDASRLEAEAYLGHPVLGPRLEECTRLVNLIEGRSIEEIFGYPDDLKFHSSVTLFAQASHPENKVFNEALTKYFNGVPDKATMDRL